MQACKGTWRVRACGILMDLMKSVSTLRYRVTPACNPATDFGTCRYTVLPLATFTLLSLTPALLSLAPLALAGD